MNQCVSVGFSGSQHAGRKIGLIRGVGKILGFEAESSATMIGDLVFSYYGWVEEIGGVKLDARLIGEDFHHSARFRVTDAGSELNTVVFRQHPTMVISFAQLEGFEVIVDAVADDVRGSEVHRGACYGFNHTRWDHAWSCWQVIGRMELHEMVGDRRGGIARKVPIRVVNDVDNRRSIGGGGRFPDQFVVIVERISDLGGEISGIALFAISG